MYTSMEGHPFLESSNMYAKRSMQIPHIIIIVIMICTFGGMDEMMSVNVIIYAIIIIDFELTIIHSHHNRMQLRWLPLAGQSFQFTHRDKLCSSKLMHYDYETIIIALCVNAMMSVFRY